MVNWIITSGGSHWSSVSWFLGLVEVLVLKRPQQS